MAPTSQRPVRREMWERSPTPAEDWGDDADAVWDVAGIVGEETDSYGTPRYEIKWGGWQRSDGTNTTWQADLDGRARNLIKRWQRKQKRKRAALAEESLSIEVAPEEGQLFHEDLDVERMRGYHEKMERAEALDNDDFEEWDDIPRPPGATPQATPMIQDDPLDAPPEEAQRRTRFSSAGSSGSSTRLQRPSKPNSPSNMSSSSTMSASAASSSGTLHTATSRSRNPHINRRGDLRDRWSSAARRAGAEGITIANEVNFEEIPPGVDNFTYLEHAYRRGPKIPKPASVFLVNCECLNGCNEAALCACQDPSEVSDEFGVKEFAYSENGLFGFNVPPGAEVIECNERCSCRANCRNRVAQKPRSVPIEIFRTEQCGWGVRSAIDLPKGKVLGVYTGEIITRKAAHSLPAASRAYVFDLDHREVEDDDIDDGRSFSVDASRCGNWTRFLNHSCQPNASVYPVYWDNVPESYQPFLAIVTNRHVIAKAELTIDYDPKAGEAFRDNEGKGKRKQKPSGARDCFCGTANCRGWVRV